MKLKEVVVGETYLTRVGEHQVPVVVLARHPGSSAFSRTGRKSADTFVVARVDGSGRALPKNRAASALHPVAKPMTMNEIVDGIERTLADPLAVAPVKLSREAFERAWDRSASPSSPKLPGAQPYPDALSRASRFFAAR